jgi:RNA polymerase sigma factor (sigma-70 family)
MASSPSFVASEPGSGPLNPAMDLESVYMNRRHDILRLLLSSGVNFSEAEDVTQQVFANAYERPATAPREGSLFSWLVRCARNLAVSRHRHHWREVLAPAELWKELEDTIANPGKSVQALMEEQEEYKLLTYALAQLSLRQQQCLLLHEEGNTFEEIAAVLNIPRSNAVYAVGAAIKKLRKILDLSDNAG